MSQKPNIVFILNDHQTYYGHGEMAGGPKIQRPYFEKLAKEGVEFNRAYTACPLCGPARRTILTGLFPHAHGEIFNDVHHPFDTEMYFDKLLKEGYKNYYFGKWHAGAGTAQDHKCNGISYPGYNNPYTKPEYKKYLKKYQLPHIQVRITHLFQDPDGMGAKELGLKVGELYTPNGLGINEHAAGIMTTPKETHEAFFLADLACEKLKELTDANEQPFHLRVDFWGPHHPYFAPQEYLDLYDPEKIPEYPNFRDDLSNKPEIYKFDTNYPVSKNRKLIQPCPLPWSVYQEILAINYAQITLIDQAGGKILETLEELELVNNTLVVWTTDHGDALACHGGRFAKGSYMPEEMVRVPLALNYPDKVRAGQKIDKLVSNLDIGPTFLDAAGISFSTPVHGRSLLPLCSQNNNMKWRDDLMCETNGCFIAHLGRLIVTDRYKYVWNYKDLDELYDLKEDPYELNNLVNNEEFAEILMDLKTRLEKWRQNTDDNLTKIMIKKARIRKAKMGINSYMSSL